MTESSGFNANFNITRCGLYSPAPLVSNNY
ncbi:hypothetical protein F-liban_307 [Faustovirus]|nr:hypothetical protein F-liban_307 [Faustovirus]